MKNPISHVRLQESHMHCDQAFQCGIEFQGKVTKSQSLYKNIKTYYYYIKYRLNGVTMV